MGLAGSGVPRHVSRQAVRRGGQPLQIPQERAGEAPGACPVVPRTRKRSNTGLFFSAGNRKWGLTPRYTILVVSFERITDCGAVAVGRKRSIRPFGVAPKKAKLTPMPGPSTPDTYNCSRSAICHQADSSKSLHRNWFQRRHWRIPSKDKSKVAHPIRDASCPKIEVCKRSVPKT